MRQGFKVAAAVVASVLLAVNAGLLIDVSYRASQCAGVPQLSRRNPDNYPRGGSSNSSDAANQEHGPGQIPSLLAQPEEAARHQKRAENADCARSGKDQDWWDRLRQGTAHTDPNWVIAFLGLGQLVVAGVQARVYWAQKNIMSGQLGAAQDAATAARDQAKTAQKTAEIADRPWADISPVVTALEMYERRARLNFRVRLENIGKAPALRVSYDTRLVPFNGDGPQLVMERLKETAADKPGDHVGIVVFPSDPIEEDEPQWTHFKSMIPMPAGQGWMLGFYVVCLATYRMNTSDTARYTGKVYTIERKVSADDRDQKGFAVVGEGRFTADEIRVSSYGPGSFATSHPSPHFRSRRRAC